MRLTSGAAALLLSPLCAALATGCDEGGPSPGDDAGPAPCAAMDALDPGGEGDPEPLAAAAGEVRAGRIEADEIPIDPHGLALIAPGDFVLANDRVAVVIEDAGESDIYDRFGGRPVGIARVEGGALHDPASFGEVLLGLGGNLVETESVGVIADGDARIVRAIGTVRNIDFLGALLPSTFFGDVAELTAAIDYRLEPGAETVSVTMVVDQRRPRSARVTLLVMGFVQGYRMPLWTRSGGFGAIGGADPPWIAFDGPGTAYAWIAPEGNPLHLLLDDTGIVVLRMDPPQLPACSQTEVPFGAIAIGEGMNGAQAIAWRGEGVPLRAIAGTVRESDGSPATGVRVHAVAGTSHLTRELVGEGGSFSIEVPEGDVELWAYRRGGDPVGPIAVPATGPVTIDMPAIGTIEVHARDSLSMEPVPARVQVMGDDVRPDDSWGEPALRSGRRAVEFAGADGIARARVPAGVHRLVVSRGYEHELVDRMVTVAAGETVVVDASLVHSVDSTGVMCADYHIHTSRSPDSGDDAPYKMLGLVADGLELPIRSDHEFVHDFEPVVQELGLGAFARGISGEELTTFSYGHFGVFPIEPDPSATNGGAPRWPGRAPADVFDDARSRAGSPVVIINHPRSGGGIGGYFTAIGYDAETGTIARMDLWDEQLELVEAFNDSSFDENRDGTVADWLSFLRSGRRMFAVGSSDSHNLSSSPVGYPRTCLALGTDDPRMVDAAQVRDATRGGHSYVSGGIQIEARAGSAGPGDDVTGAGDRASIDVVVRAATWIDVDELEVIVDGDSVETIPIAETGTDPDPTVRLRATIEAPIAPGESFVILHASGGDALEPVHPGRMPFAVTNPIFFRR